MGALCRTLQEFRPFSPTNTTSTLTGHGVYSGLHSDGRHMLLGWALGRDEENLKRAAETLQTNADLTIKLS